MACTTNKFKKLSTITGAFLLLMPTGVQWYWGNLSIYVISMYHNQNNLVTGTDSSWIISLASIFRATFYILSGYIIRIIGQRMTLLLGIVLFNSGVIASYYALNYTVTVFNFTFGLLCGIGSGLLYGPSFLWAIQWSDFSDTGLITSIVQISFPFGAILINQFVTFYLNPFNVKPDIVYKGYKFFSHKSILGSVPYVFLIMTFSFCSIQLFGLFMLKKKSDIPKTNGNGKPDTNCSNQNNSSANDISRHSYHTRGMQDRTPKQMVCSLPFYILASTYILNDYTYLIVVNYYKAFGQLWIRDDHFLTYLAVAMVIINVPARLICGLLTDKIGVKYIFVGGFCLATAFCSFISFLPKVDRWLYFFVTTFLSGATGAMVSAYTIATVNLYGQKDSIINYGIVNYATVTTFIAAPPLMELIITNWGWNALFLSAAFLNSISQIIIVGFFPKI